MLVKLLGAHLKLAFGVVQYSIWPKELYKANVGGFSYLCCLILGALETQVDILERRGLFGPGVPRADPFL